MIPNCWPEIILIVAWLVGVYLIFRVSAFRADQPDHSGHFGVPYFWNWKYFDPANFTAEGRPFLYWLWLDTGIFAVSGALAVAICV